MSNKSIFSQPKKLLLLSCIALSGLLLHGIVSPGNADALSGSDWSSGRIIDDSIFYNPNSMSTGEIQNFLNSKVPTCDTNGTQAYGGGTRASYATGRGYPPPYTCLKDYSQTTVAKPVETGLCNGYSATAQTAAQIIYGVSQSCGINPKVLLVLLQKEQSLVSDDWPWSIQYRSATGYGCPDTAPCDAEYYGFFNQVYSAARQFKRYAKDANLFNYRAGRENYIQYNPNASCGGSNVYIHNQATAGLYNYTPYQPNAAALANLYGTGDSCSAYGNRNFWRMYNDWFNLNESVGNALTMRTVTSPELNPFRGQTITYAVSFTNNASVSLGLDAIGIVGRLGSPSSSINKDFGWQGPAIIGPGQTQTFTFTTTVSDTGTIYAWPAIRYTGSYIHYMNWGMVINARLPNISVTSPLSSTPTTPVAGQSGTISATIKNNESVPVTLEAVGIPVRFFGKYNYDTGWSSSPITLAPGASHSVTGPILYDKPGPYTVWLSALLGGQYTTLFNPYDINTSKLTPKFELTYLETPNPSPALGEDIAIKFKLKNNSGSSVTLDAVGIVGRYDNPFSGQNRDFGWVGPETFTAGQEKSYTAFVSNVSDIRDFYSWIALNYQGNYIHYNQWGFVLKPRIPNISITSPLTVNGGTKPTIGASVPVTVTIKNNEPKAIRYSALGIPIKFYGVYSYDTGWITNGTLPSSGSPGDTITLSGTVNFNKPGPYTLWPSAYIQGRYIVIGGSQSVLNLP